MVAIFIAGYRLFQEQSVKKVITSFGKAINTGQIEQLNNKFTPKAIFSYNTKQISYIEALECLSTKVSKELKGDMYVDSIKEISSKNATVTFILWVSMKGDSHEVSGIVEFDKTSLWSWKIKKIISENRIFEEIFY